MGVNAVAAVAAPVCNPEQVRMHSFYNAAWPRVVVVLFAKYRFTEILLQAALLQKSQGGMAS